MDVKSIFLILLVFIEIEMKLHVSMLISQKKSIILVKFNQREK